MELRSTANAHRPPPLWRLLLAALFYFGAIEAGFWTRGPGETVAPVWPAAGVAIWLVIRFGGWMLGPIVVGEFVANLLSPGTSGVPLIVVLLRPMTFGNALTALAGCWIFRRVRLRYRTRLGGFSEAAAIVMSSLVAPLIAATIGILALQVAGRVPPVGPARAWLVWWTSDVVGILLILPALLRLTRGTRRRLIRSSRGDVTRAGLTFLLVLAVSALSGGRMAPVGILFGLLPLLLITTAWFGATGARMVVLLVATMGIVAARNGQGPLATGNVNEDLLNVQLFLAALVLVALALPPIHARLNLMRRRSLILLLGGWALSGALFAFVQRQQDHADAASFAQLTTNAQADIERRVETYMDLLRAGAAFASVSEGDQSAWTTFVGSFDLKGRYPGIANLGVIYPVQPDEALRFETRIRARGSPDFRIQRPDGAPPTSKSPSDPPLILTLAAPFPTDSPLVGMDIRSDPTRRVSAEAARDSGEARMSSLVGIGAARERPGVILYVPVYRRNRALTSVDERRQAFQALVDAPIVLESFFEGVLGSRSRKLRLHLFDGDRPLASRLIYTTDEPSAPLPEFLRLVTVQTFGRTFTMGWTPGPGFQRTGPSPLIWLALSLAVATLFLTGRLVSLQTYRERAEALVAERTAALRQSEARHRAVIEWTPTGVLVHREGRIVFANPAAARTFGASNPEELVGRPVSDLVPLDSTGLLTGVEGDRPNSSRDAPPLEGPMIRLDGSRIDAEIVTTAIEFDGEPAFHSSIHDVTARKQAEAARTTLEVQLRRSQRLEAIGTLAGGIAHDFNNLLAAVLGNVETALWRVDGDSAISENLNEIRKAAFRGRDLVTQVLSFSHPQPADRAAIHLAPIVLESTRFVRATLPPQVIVESECEPGAPRVLANGLQIQRLIINLASNAGQAMVNGSGRVEIRLDSPPLDDEQLGRHPELKMLRTGSAGRYVRLTVRDDGRGMDGATVERIFEPFFTTRAGGSGTGLGLAVVHGIVQTHEGVILVDSEPGRGTLFTVWLKAAPGGMGG